MDEEECMHLERENNVCSDCGEVIELVYEPREKD